MSVIISALGGLALFLLAMTMMTDGLKVSAGSALKDLLEKWTSNPARGIFSGILVTSLVQSSSAVTVTTIGFVNAGIMTLRQALAVIFGANIGTTITGWLVSLTGLGFKIEALSLPLLALGVATKFLAPRKKIQGLGEAIIGFGLFFLGLSILKESFASLATTINVGNISPGFAGTLIALAIGFMATVLTQSSSAAMAIILTAAGESIIGVPIAAAAIIGANIGTTSTALFATIGATPNARRVATGHIIFNIVTGAVALMILPVFILILSRVSQNFGQDGNVIFLLAMFHTAFNIFGVLLFFPFIGKFAAFLEKRFVTEDDNYAQPLYLDHTITIMPSLAISAIRAELNRAHGAFLNVVDLIIHGDHLKTSKIESRIEAIGVLTASIDEYATKVSQEKMTKAEAGALPEVLGINRYLKESETLLIAILEVRQAAAVKPGSDLASAFENMLGTFDSLCGTYKQKLPYPSNIDDIFVDLDETYKTAKAIILRMGAKRTFSLEKTTELLDGISHSRRAIKQLGKAGKLLTDDIGAAQTLQTYDMARPDS